MKTKKINLTYKGKKIKLKVKVCNEFEKFKGLMFTRYEKAKILLFEFKKPARYSIHSLFVFFPFVAIWLDEKNRVIDIKRVGSWKFRVRPKKKFSKLVEIPIHQKYKEIIDKFN